jgi:hypothetical protein
MLIGLIFLSFFSSCGRPKNFTQTAALNFSGAYATFANTYNLGVLIYATKDDGRVPPRRFWIGRNNEAYINSYIQPGAWTFYGIGFHEPVTSPPGWAPTNLIKCAMVNQTLRDGNNDVTLNFESCGSENDHFYPELSGDPIKRDLGKRCSDLNRLDCYL